MSKTFTLEHLLRIGIKPIDGNTYAVSAEDSNGYSVDPDELVSYLFFNDERTFFGLLAEISR